MAATPSEHDGAASSPEGVSHPSGELTRPSAAAAHPSRSGGWDRDDGTRTIRRRSWGHALSIRQRSGRLPRRRRKGSRTVSIVVNLAAMMDMTFLLLIFFLVTTTFERAEGLLASEMPREGAGASVALPLSPIVVRLARAGADPDEVTISIDRVEAAPQTIEELVAHLRDMQALPGFDKDTPVVLVADGEVIWDHLVDAWNAALRAGYSRIAFGEP